MYILAIETTGAYASVALLQATESNAGQAAKTHTGQAAKPHTGDAANIEDGRILGVIHGNDRFSHLQNLTPQINEILQQNKLSISDISAIAVSHGPGSFTGIRIGVSTARALAQVLDIPCIPVSSLEALALRSLEAQEKIAADLESDNGLTQRLVCPVLDARRKQVYGAAYEIIDGEPVCRIAPASCLMAEFLQKLDQYFAESAAENMQVWFIGDGIDTCGELIREWEAAKSGTEVAETGAGTIPTEVAETGAETIPIAAAPEKMRDQDSVAFAPEEIRYQDAAAVALRGLQLYRAGRSCHYIDLQPEYLRMAEAERKLREKQAARPAFAGESES